MQLDLQSVADAVIKNNMGLGAMELSVRARIDGSEAVLEQTGQRFRVEGVEGTPGRPWQRFVAEGLQAGEQVVLYWQSEGDAP